MPVIVGAGSSAFEASGSSIKFPTATANLSGINTAAKIGQDDNGVVACQNGASGGGHADNTNLSGVDMWWWIK